MALSMPYPTLNLDKNTNKVANIKTLFKKIKMFILKMILIYKFVKTSI